MQKDETAIKVESECIWIWWIAAIEIESKEIIGINNRELCLKSCVNDILHLPVK
jgi:hypothetical protein